MNIRQLKTFVAVADAGSFSKAAQGLFTTPTALTQQVNALERTLGFPLLKRTYRGVELTEGGAVYCGYARQLIDLARTAEDEARQAAGVGRQRIRVSTYRSVEVVLLQPHLEGFARMCPDVEVEFVDGDYRDDLDALLAGTVDMYVHPYGSELDRADVGFQKLGSTGLCCSMSYEDPLALRTSIAPADLAGRDVIAGCGCSSRSLDEVRERLVREQPGVNLQRFTTESEVWNHVLRQGSLLLNMEYAARYLGSCVSVPFEWPQRFDFGFVFRLPRARAVGRLLDYMKTQMVADAGPSAPSARDAIG